jgi:hypothetical protein
MIAKVLHKHMAAGTEEIKKSLSRTVTVEAKT